MNERFMREAIRLAEEGMEQGFGGPFGAVIVKDESIVGRGFNAVLAGPDPTAHAEVQAIRDACSSLQKFDLSGHVIYASCEPCPMCLAAIHWARLDQIYFSADRGEAAAIGFDDAKIASDLGQVGAARGVPMEQLMPGAASSIMRAWSAKLDRRQY